MLRALRRTRLPTTCYRPERLVCCAHSTRIYARQGFGPASVRERTGRLQPQRYASTANASATNASEQHQEPTWDFPSVCPGCGAQAQQRDPDVPGYYPVKPPARFREHEPLEGSTEEEEIFKAALAKVSGDTKLLQDLRIVQKKGAKKGVPPPAIPEEEDEIPIERGLDGEEADKAREEAERRKKEKKKREDADLEVLEMLPEKARPKICERCHSMLHHHTAPDLPESTKPSIARIADFIKLCGHRKNHIYHLIDAADLPLTFIPDLHQQIAARLSPSMASRLTISYVVTRADVLMPKDEEINILRPKIKKILESQLPEGYPLETEDSKFRIVSFRLGMGVGGLKSELKQGMREGGVWIVGKVNVGKSRVVTDIIPPGSFPTPLVGQQVDSTQQLVSPTVSDIPGTTAAPVRISFMGDSKNPIGEIVDLPGLDRESFVGHVRPEFKKKLILKDRKTGLQQIVKSGQSILVAGIILITPKFSNPNTIFTFNPFVDVPIHITATDKAFQLLRHPTPGDLPWPGKVLWQNPPAGKEEQPSVLSLTEAITDRLVRQLNRKESPLAEVAPELLENKPPPHIQKVGEFKMTDDVTLIRNEKVDKKDYPHLPYRIYATDIVLSGLGWIEIAAQVRRKRFNRLGQDTDAPEYPTVEIYSPGGMGVGTRPTLNVDRLRLEAERAAAKRGPRRGPARGRPRKSIRSGYERK